MANTTWSTTDKTNITLSGSDLIATANAGTAFVRGKDPKRTGKYYFEITMVTWGSANSTLGVANFVQIANSSQDAAASFIVGKGGLIKSGATVTKATLSARAAGDIFGVAVDLDNGLGWFRVAPAGNWNGNAGYFPDTGVGGIRLSPVPLGQGFDAYPCAQLVSISDQATLNSGGSAFSGAVPTGFTSGWTDSVAISTKVVLQQMKLEVWGSTVNVPYVPPITDDFPVVDSFHSFP